MKEKVSIIIPCYNKGAYIKEALESSLSQTYPNIEIVCYNDGSSDNSSAVIQEFANKYSNFLFIDSKENKGVIAARNSAIENSSGVYILPLDADDKIAPTYVEKAEKIQVLVLFIVRQKNLVLLNATGFYQSMMKQIFCIKIVFLYLHFLENRIL